MGIFVDVLIFIWTTTFDKLAQCRVIREIIMSSTNGACFSVGTLRRYAWANLLGLRDWLNYLFLLQLCYLNGFPFTFLVL